MGKGNGAHKASLEMLGAPQWYIEGELQADERYDCLHSRVSSLEVAVMKGASKSGRKWGAVFGTLTAFLVAFATTYCQGSPPL